MAIGRERTDLANVGLESLDAVTAEDKPDLERAEPTAKAEVPVAVVHDEACEASTISPENTEEWLINA